MARWAGGPQLASPAQKGTGLNFSAWVEVDLTALEHNLRWAQSLSRAPILPILKSDAYGHGAPVVAAFLHNLGCTSLGVSTVEEALDILAWLRTEIVLLTPPLPDQLEDVVEHKLVPTLTSPEQVSDLNRLARRRGIRLKVQIKVDTGLGRLGIAPEYFFPLVQQIAKASHLELRGVFTHFAAAPGDRKFTKQQLERLIGLKTQFTKETAHSEVLWHAANSAAFLTFPESHLDLVRLGTLLYGQSPLPSLTPPELQNTWQFKARIIHTRVLPPGHSVGYGRTYRTTRPTRVGVIPVGYSQGLALEPQPAPWRQLRQAAARLVRPRPAVELEGLRLPILGRISMGLSTIDLTTSTLDVGDAVTLRVRRTVVSSKIPRLYFWRGKLKCILWNNQVLDPKGRRISLKGLFEAESPLPLSCGQE